MPRNFPSELGAQEPKELLLSQQARCPRPAAEADDGQMLEAGGGPAELGVREV